VEIFSSGRHPENAVEPTTSFSQFLRALWAQWFSAMSGPLAVPLGIAAVFVESTLAKVLLGGTAVLCLVLAAYFTWRYEAQKVIELEGKIEPKLHGKFDETDKSCLLETTISPFHADAPLKPQLDTWQTMATASPFFAPTGAKPLKKARYIRPRIWTTSVLAVPGVCAHLRSITRESDKMIYPVGLDLTIAPSERLEPTKKDIHPGYLLNPRLSLILPGSLAPF
jgi:hypothetical protein